MTRANSPAVASLMLAALCGAAVAADAELIEKAKKEGPVYYYTTRVQTMNALTRGFEAKYGIKALGSSHSNEALIAKIVNETKAGTQSADVFDGSSGITILMEADLVAPYKPKEAESFAPAYKHPDGYWTAINLYVSGLAYNTDQVKGADVPKTVDDLLDPKWAGRRITYTMQYTVSGINGFYGGLEKERGPDKARAFIAQLHKNGAVAQNALPGATLDGVASGQYAFCIGCNSNQVHGFKRKGAPVEMSSVQPIVTFFSAMGITRAARSPNAARLFVEYAMSAEGQKIIEDGDYISVQPNMESKFSHLRPGAGAFTVTPELVASDLPRWSKVQTEVRQ